MVTAVNASGESPISTQVSATPTPDLDRRRRRRDRDARSASSSPWFNELQVRLANTSPITAMTVTVVVQRTTGVSHSGQYNTVGGQIAQSVTEHREHRSSTPGR